MKAPVFLARLRKRTRRLMQTRTEVHTEEESIQSRMLGRLTSWHWLGAILLFAQLILWVVLAGYDNALQGTWQAAIMLLMPGLGLYLLWRAAAKGLAHRQAKWPLLCLLPSLILDIALLLAAWLSLMRQLMPSYPEVVLMILCLVMTFLAALLGRENGVAYGGGMLRWLLLGFLALVLLHANAGRTSDRLFPVLGHGLTHTAKTALTGVGAVWPVALFFVLPCHKDAHQFLVRAQKQPKTLLFLLPVFLLCILYSLSMAATAPWNPVDQLRVGEKLIALSRHTRSMLITELGSLWWLILLPLCAVAGLTSAGSILRRAAPRFPRWLALLAALLPGAAMIVLWPGILPRFLIALLPYRVIFPLLSGIWLCVLGRRQLRG
ncbi:MAG: hypothetical protein E7319_04760 [Clostridiales bacterium]|nr:hypothetical protein [Clostridiales bacterium]